MINGDLYEHPDVKPALDRAGEIVDAWIEHGLYAGDGPAVRKAVVGYARIDIIEKIACEILSGQGISGDDLDLFDDLYWDHVHTTGTHQLWELWDLERRRRIEA